MNADLAKTKNRACVIERPEELDIMTLHAEPDKETFWSRVGTYQTASFTQGNRKTCQIHRIKAYIELAPMDPYRDSWESQKGERLKNTSRIDKPHMKVKN